MLKSNVNNTKIMLPCHLKIEEIINKYEDYILSLKRSMYKYVYLL